MNSPAPVLSDKQAAKTLLPSALKVAAEIQNANTPVDILLVDDEARNLDVLESILKSPDYRLFPGANRQKPR